MKKEKIRDEIITGSIHNKLRLQYFLLSNSTEETVPREYYGICVETYKIPEESMAEEFVESETVAGVTESHDLAIQLIHTLGKNTVTPVTLIEILDDLQSEHELKIKG